MSNLFIVIIISNRSTANGSVRVAIVLGLHSLALLRDLVPFHRAHVVQSAVDIFRGLATLEAFLGRFTL
jgi:low temperature requirement protein LtrA